ncbi:MAG: hypothetical protein LBD91_01290 [Prevotellaceae bacterium]|nr:hypothetical protein [Prevotellaceae bacterium]
MDERTESPLTADCLAPAAAYHQNLPSCPNYAVSPMQRPFFTTGTTFRHMSILNSQFIWFLS